MLMVEKAFRDDAEKRSLVCEMLRGEMQTMLDIIAHYCPDDYGLDAMDNCRMRKAGEHTPAECIKCWAREVE